VAFVEGAEFQAARLAPDCGGERGDGGGQGLLVAGDGPDDGDHGPFAGR
jgi:hypothetical protein